MLLRDSTSWNTQDSRARPPWGLSPGTGGQPADKTQSPVQPFFPNATLFHYIKMYLLLERQSFVRCPSSQAITTLNNVSGLFLKSG